MNMQLTRNCKKDTQNAPIGVWRTLLFCMVFIGAFAAKAQIVPENADLIGKWVFSYAEKQERPLGSSKEFSQKAQITVAQIEEKDYFKQIPLKLSFGGSTVNLKSVNTESLELNYSLQKAGKALIITNASVGSQPSALFGTYTNLVINGNTFNMDYSYFYKNEQGQYEEGILTVYFSKD